MKKPILLFSILIFVGSIISNCGVESEVSLSANENVKFNITLAGLTLNQSYISGKSTASKTGEISNWSHIFEDNLAIIFTNVETEKIYSLNYNPSQPDADYTIILPFGTYSYILVSEGNEYSHYIPFVAEGTIEISKNLVNLDMVGITHYGLVTVDQNHISDAYIKDTELGDIELSTSQGHFYSYVIEGREPLVIATEDILNTTPSIQLPQIQALVRYNLSLNFNALDVTSFTLATFNQIDYYFDLEQESLWNGIVAWYPFNGNANDESGNGNHGEVNGVTLTSDRNGIENTAYNFSTNQDIVVPKTEDKNLFPITISLWYYANNLNSKEVSNLFSKYVTTSWNGYQILFGDFTEVENNGIYVNNGFGVTPWYVTSQTNRLIGYYTEPPFLQKFIEAETWYHYVFVVDENGGYIYVNGELIQQKEWTGTPGVSANNYLWKIGGNYETSKDWWFQGKIDDVGIWNRALSAEEVQKLYTN